MDAFDQRPNAALVRGIRGPNELIIRDRQPAPHLLKDAGDAIHERLRRHAAFIGRLLHLLAMLVHPHQEVDVVTSQAVITGNDVGADLLERMAEMRIAVSIVDRRREKELGQWSSGSFAVPSDVLRR